MAALQISWLSRTTSFQVSPFISHAARVAWHGRQSGEPPSARWRCPKSVSANPRMAVSSGGTSSG